MRPARPGSVWRGPRASAGSTCGWRRRGRSRRVRAIASRPTAATRSGIARLLAAGELRSRSCPAVADECFRDLVRCDRGCPRRSDARPSPAVEVPAAPRRALSRPGRRPGRARTWPGCARSTSTTPARRRRSPTTWPPSSCSPAAAHVADRGARAGRSPRPATPPVIARLRCFRGIDTLSAAGLCAEVGDFGRFPQPNAALGLSRDRPLRAHLGHQAPPGLDHQGRPRPRPPAAGRGRPPLPLPAAHRRTRSPAAKPGQDPRVIEIAWRAQRRLHHRWQHLHHQRRKPAGVVAIAVARELAAFLWEAATLD